MTAAAHLDLPFGFAAGGRTATAPDDDHVADLIRMVLFTAPGERVNRPDFGCGLRRLVFAPASDALAAATQQMVHGALLRWLGEVIAVDAVDVALDDAVLTVTVGYTVRRTGRRQVTPFVQPVAP